MTFSKSVSLLIKIIILSPSLFSHKTSHDALKMSQIVAKCHSFPKMYDMLEVKVNQKWPL